MSGRTQGPIPTATPKQRNMSAKSLVLSLDGPERPYPVYRLPLTDKYEKPRHNPFSGL